MRSGRDETGVKKRRMNREGEKEGKKNKWRQ